MNLERPRQLWRDEMIDSHERLEEFRLLLRKQCDIPPPPAGDSVVDHPYELNVIFRISQLVYGTAAPGHQHIRFQIMRLAWFREDGHLPEHLLRAHEMLQEEPLRDKYKDMYRFAVENPFPADIEALEDNERFVERLGMFIAHTCKARGSVYAL